MHSTLPDYFTSRFDDRKRYFPFSAVIILVSLFTGASGMVAGARLFENLFGMSYTTAIWLCYCNNRYVCIGGFQPIS